jgi:hypothetical protein
MTTPEELIELLKSRIVSDFYAEGVDPKDRHAFDTLDEKSIAFAINFSYPAVAPDNMQVNNPHGFVHMHPDIRKLIKLIQSTMSKLEDEPPLMIFDQHLNVLIQILDHYNKGDITMKVTFLQLIQAMEMYQSSCLSLALQLIAKDENFESVEVELQQIPRLTTEHISDDQIKEEFVKTKTYKLIGQLANKISGLRSESDLNAAFLSDDDYLKFPTVHRDMEILSCFALIPIDFQEYLERKVNSAATTARPNRLKESTYSFHSLAFEHFSKFLKTMPDITYDLDSVDFDKLFINDKRKPRDSMDPITPVSPVNTTDITRKSSRSQTAQPKSAPADKNGTNKAKPPPREPKQSRRNVSPPNITGRRATRYARSDISDPSNESEVRENDNSPTHTEPVTRSDGTLTWIAENEQDIFNVQAYIESVPELLDIYNSLQKIPHHSERFGTPILSYDHIVPNDILESDIIVKSSHDAKSKRFVLSHDPVAGYLILNRVSNYRWRYF